MSKFTDLATDYEIEKPSLTTAEDDIRATLNKIKKKLNKISDWDTGSGKIIEKNKEGRSHTYIIQIAGANYNSALTVNMANYEIIMEGVLSILEFMQFVENQYTSSIDARILELQELKTE